MGLDGCLDGYLDGYLDGCLDGYLDARLDGYLDARLDACLDGSRFRPVGRFDHDGQPVGLVRGSNLADRECPSIHYKRVPR